MNDLNLTRLSATDPDFAKSLDHLLSWDEEADHKLHETVRQILADVRQRGDAAVLEYTNRFDRLNVQSASAFEPSVSNFKDIKRNITHLHVTERSI